jgi:hypothetical protein
MLMFSKVINEETKEVQVGFGDNKEYFESLGMTLQDVGQTEDGKWYLSKYIPMEKLKAQKREEINKARDAAEQGGFEYLGKTFDSDQVSCLRMTSAAQAMALAPEESAIVWTCQDNTTISLNKEQLVGLVASLAQHSNSCHQKATALKAEIDKAKTAEELEKITWSDQD